MNIWAISDLHLSFHRPKPMDVFGPRWADHAHRIATAWRERVGEDDVVCLPGDLSWAMRLSEALPELEWLADLPGRKVLVKGNHDYWWSSPGKLRGSLPEGICALHNDAALIGDVGFCGSRGWVDPDLDFSALFPPQPGEDGPVPLIGLQGEAEDRRIYQRELARLERSLAALDRLTPPGGVRVVLTHFPPTSPVLEETPVTRLLEKHRVDYVVFGHLHGEAGATFRNPYGTRAGITYLLTSADFVEFAPLHVCSVGTP